MPVKDHGAQSRSRSRQGTPLICCIPLLCLALGSLCFTTSVLPDPLFSPAHHPLPSPSINNTPHCVNTDTSCPSSWLRHSMDDKELLCCALMAPPRSSEERVAFMFLTRGRMPLRPLWERFFHKSPRRHFSIYLHTSPEYTEEPPESSVFSRRRIPSKRVEWGHASMIDAERRLLANALLDSSNMWFILLSESCIPLFNFSTVYNFVHNSELSFVSSFDDLGRTGRGRYNKGLAPLISLQDWRKGSQWFAVTRKLATEIVLDRKYYQMFKEHCRPPCYMDEHYLPTLVTKLFPMLNSNRSLTWVDWSKRGSHPKTFRHKDVSEWLIQSMRHGPNCRYKDNTSAPFCSFFARKFHSSALGPLMRIAPTLLGFDR